MNTPKALIYSCFVSSRKPWKVIVLQLKVILLQLHFQEQGSIINSDIESSGAEVADYSMNRIS